MMKKHKSLRIALFLVLCVFVLTGCTPRDYTWTSDVKGLSMYPTILDGAQVVIRETTDIRHDDIVCFKKLNEEKNEYEYIIKRVIAMGNDTIAFVKQEETAYFNIYLNDAQLDEYYLDTAMPYGQTTLREFVQNHFERISEFNYKFTVPANEMFVMGDNRRDSLDSRHYGPVPLSDAIGKVIEIINY